MAAQKKSKSKRTIECFHVTWQGIELEIRYERYWLGSADDEFRTSHIEVESINPAKAELPITETGYRSHFLNPEDADEAGGPVAFVTFALDEAARSKAWKARCETKRQLTLF